MRIFPILLSLVALLYSCGSLKKMDISGEHVPSLGTIGTQSQSLLHTSFQGIGNPTLQRPIAVSIREVPFTRSSFKKYMAYRKDLSAEGITQFVDSLGTKTNYLCLEIRDRIALRDALNSIENSNVLSYLEKDDAYRLVYKVALVPNPEEYLLLTQANGLFLKTDRNGVMILKMGNGSSPKELNLSGTEIFDYTCLEFCWGETQYGKKQIEALVGDGDSCPKNTERKAYKLDETKSYLKL